jgi:hypothetical protein
MITFFLAGCSVDISSPQDRDDEIVSMLLAGGVLTLDEGLALEGELVQLSSQETDRVAALLVERGTARFGSAIDPTSVPARWVLTPSGVPITAVRALSSICSDENQVNEYDISLEFDGVPFAKQNINEMRIETQSLPLLALSVIHGGFDLSNEPTAPEDVHFCAGVWFNTESVVTPAAGDSESFRTSSRIALRRFCPYLGVEGAGANRFALRTTSFQAFVAESGAESGGT